MGLLDSRTVKSLTSHAGELGQLVAEEACGNLPPGASAEEIFGEHRRESLQQSFGAAAAEIGSDKAVKKAVSAAASRARMAANLLKVTPARPLEQMAQDRVRAVLVIDQPSEEGTPLPRAGNVVPQHVIENLADFGDATLDARLRCTRQEHYGWDFIGPVAALVNGVDSARAIAELDEAAMTATDPTRARIGAYLLLAEASPESRDPRYLGLLDSFLDYMKARGLSSAHLTGHEAKRWVECHGELPVSFDGIVAVETPQPGDEPDAAPPALGEERLLALTAPLPDGNAFFAQQNDDGTFSGYSERKRSSEDTTRKRYDEPELSHCATYSSLLTKMGAMFGDTPYWAHEELMPYFPRRRM